MSPERPSIESWVPSNACRSAVSTKCVSKVVSCHQHVWREAHVHAEQQRCGRHEAPRGHEVLSAHASNGEGLRSGLLVGLPRSGRSDALQASSRRLVASSLVGGTRAKIAPMRSEAWAHLRSDITAGGAYEARYATPTSQRSSLRATCSAYWATTYCHEPPRARVGMRGSKGEREAPRGSLRRGLAASRCALAGR